MAKRKEFLLRMDPAVHDALRRWSDDQLRSLNAQIEFLLRRALEKSGRLPQETGEGADAPSDSSDSTSG